jgi:hypothetical protein
MFQSDISHLFPVSIFSSTRQMLVWFRALCRRDANAAADAADAAVDADAADDADDADAEAVIAGCVGGGGVGGGDFGGSSGVGSSGSGGGVVVVGRIVQIVNTRTYNAVIAGLAHRLRRRAKLAAAVRSSEEESAVAIARLADSHIGK